MEIDGTSGKRFALQQLMRWYGPPDPVPLEHIAQAGCSGVVSALHAIPPGEVWPEKDIRFHKTIIEKAGLTWTVVESLPVHENIKTRSVQYKACIENYKESLVNLAACGIEVVTYNFMPVLDWVRTDVAYVLPDGAETLVFNADEFDAFDIFMLQRPGATEDRPEDRLQYLHHFYESLDHTTKDRIYKNVLLGLPGSDVPFTPGEVLEKLEAYRHIDRAKLKEHLVLFLKEIAPVASDAGIRLAIHPDDPPFPVLGLPRIMSTEKDIEDIVSAVPDASNGLCFCTGSLGVRPDNDLPAMIRRWGARIYFLHLRNTKRDARGNFMEAPHLAGDMDTYVAMSEVVRLMQTEKRSIPMRPDHGFKMLDDLGKKVYPGYSAIGRLKGLAELRGLEYAILNTMK